MTGRPEPFTVHVIDDHPVVRQGLALVLDGDHDVVLQGGSSSASEAIVAVRRDQPTVVLLDVRLPGSDVVSTVSSLRKVSPRSAVLLFTADPEHPLIPAALRMGAQAVISKDVPPAQLRSMLIEAAQGRLKPVVRTRERQLTPRQQDVLERVARGMSNAEIAEELGIQVATVKDYWKLTMQRLGARNRPEAIARAYRLGLL